MPRADGACRTPRRTASASKQSSRHQGRCCCGHVRLRRASSPAVVLASRFQARLPRQGPYRWPPQWWLQRPLRAASPTPSFRDFTATWLSEHQIEWRRSHIKVLNSHAGRSPAAALRRPSRSARSPRPTSWPSAPSWPTCLAASATKLSNKRINGILAPLRQILAEAADRYGFVSPRSTSSPLRCARPTSSRSRWTRCSRS